MGKSTTIIVLLALGIGAFAGSAWQKAQAPAPEPQSRDAISSDLAEYQELKTQEEKYRKADEILGKMMAIFLADLGLRTKAKLPSIETLATQPETPHEEPVKPLPPSPPAPKAAEAPAAPAVAKVPNWIAVEASLGDVHNESDAKDFLARARVDDFDSLMKNTVRFSNRSEQLELLNGRFMGTAQVARDGKAAVWGVNLQLQAEMVDGALKGTMNTRLSENGKVFSNSRDRGNIPSIREFSSGNMIIVRASPSMSLQTYYVKGIDSLIGNIYEKNEDNVEIFIGTFQAVRRN